MRQERGPVHAGVAEPNVGAAPEVIESERRPDANDGEVAVATTHLDPGMPRAWGASGQAKRGDKLVRTQVRHEWPEKKAFRWYQPHFPSTANLHLPTERRSDYTQLGRGIGMGEAAADRPAIPHSNVTDMRDRFSEKRASRADHVAPLECPVTHERAKPEDAVREFHGVKAAHRIQVH